MRKQYKLSAESQKTGQEFSYATKVASSLLKALKAMVREKNSRLLYNDLCSLLIKIVNTGPIELKGNRTLTDGDLSLFRGFKLNHYQYLSTLTAFRPEVHLSAEGKYIEMATPQLNQDTFKSPLRAKIASISFQCILLDPNNLTTEIIRTDDLDVPLNEMGVGAKRIKIPIENSESKIVILSMAVYLHLRNTHSPSTFISHNREHIAGEILQAAYIRNGKIVPYIATENPLKKEVLPQETIKTIPWMDV